MIYLSHRARAALRPSEVLAFDWVPIRVCCALAGEHNLRLTTHETVDPVTYRVLPAAGLRPGQVVADRLGHPQLVEIDIRIDCRRWLGVRRFRSDLPPDTGLRAAVGWAVPMPDAATSSHRPYASVLGGAQ